MGRESVRLCLGTTIQLLHFHPLDPSGGEEMKFRLFSCVMAFRLAPPPVLATTEILQPVGGSGVQPPDIDLPNLPENFFADVAPGGGMQC